jgi:hypothetical protein
MPHRTTIDYSNQKVNSVEQEQVNVMLKALVDKIKQDVVAETKKRFKL